MSPPTTMSLLNSPPEVIQQIVLHAIQLSPLGPPSILYTLLLTCRTLYSFLSSSLSLYADIFNYKFDTIAPTRRLGSDCLNPSNTSLELRQRFSALRCFFHRRLDDPYVPQALMVAFLMLLEDDGRNLAQLRWAGLPAFLDAFIKRGKMLNINGWPVENETNSLVVSLTWLIFSVWPRSAAHSLQAYTFAAFRYPFTNTPERHFYASRLDRGKFITDSVHGPYPPSRVKPMVVIHYGQTIQVQIPPVAISALLSYFTDKTSLPMATVSPEANHFETRAQAAAVGGLGPTREDVAIVNLDRLAIISLEDDMFMKSQTYDTDWVRAVQYMDPSPMPSLQSLAAHKLGTLTGYWIGTSIIPDVCEYARWMNNTDAPDSFDECASRRPLYFSLQEHFCLVPSLPVPLDDEENGIINAWLPPNCKLLEAEGGINISDQLGTSKIFYETWNPDSDFDGSQCALDIIVSGKTDDQHAAAWGGYKFIGRIRQSDGLIVLLREPISPEITGAGKVLFRGHSKWMP